MNCAIACTSFRCFRERGLFGLRRCRMRSAQLILLAALAAAVAVPASAGQPLRPAVPPEIGVAPLVGPVWGAYRCARGPVYNFYYDAYYGEEPPALHRGYAYRSYYRYTAYRRLPRTYFCVKPRLGSKSPTRRFLCLVLDRTSPWSATRIPEPGPATFHPASVFEPGFGRWRYRQRPFPAARREIMNRNMFSTNLAYRRIRRGFVLRTATLGLSRRRLRSARLFLPEQISCRTRLSRSSIPTCG
jgi:hypothetical protein